VLLTSGAVERKTVEGKRDLEIRLALLEVGIDAEFLQTAQFGSFPGEPRRFGDVAMRNDSTNKT